jgi:hypothetical protein
MNENYIIVLFKNKIKKKIINKFKTNKKAFEFYDSLLKNSNEVKFYKKYENGIESSYDLAVLEVLSGATSPLFMKDDFGRQIRINLEDSEYTISKINRYYPEEFILDYDKKIKLTLNDFIKTHINNGGYKLISKLNNKIVVQNDDNFKLFTLKNSDDADRFIDTLSNIFLTDKKSNALLVKDYSTQQRKYLYDILVNKGYPKSYLLRHSTTHLQ